MSWGTGVHTIDKDQIGSLEAGANSDPDAQASQDEQFAAALQAAQDLAAAVGRPHDQVSVSLTGHANPGHAPRSGWADEFIQVNISARPAPVEEPTPEDQS